MFGQLARLTPLNNESRYKSIKDLYPQRHGALEVASPVLKYVPTLQEVLDLNDGWRHKEEKLKGDKQRNRSDYFVSATLSCRRNESTSDSRYPRSTGKWQYRGVCRVSIIIYKTTCKMTNKIYIGNTQQTFKKRMAGQSPLGLLCQTCFQHLAKRSCSTITTNAVGPHKMQHFMTRQPNLGGQHLRQVLLCSVQQRNDVNS
jgi:hypothetical protein